MAKPVLSGLAVNYHMTTADIYIYCAMSPRTADDNLKPLSEYEYQDQEDDPLGYLISVDGCERHEVPNPPSRVPNWGRPRLASLLAED